MPNRNSLDLEFAYGETPRKVNPKDQKTKVESEAQRFEDVARKLFKVPKSEIAPKGKKA